MVLLLPESGPWPALQQGPRRAGWPRI